MQRASAGLLSLLLSGTLGLTAQSVYHPPQEQSAGVAGMESMGGGVFSIGGLNSTAPEPVVTPKAAICPVQMQAQHGTGRGLLVVRRDNKNGSKTQPDQPSQRIHLILGDGDGKRIVQARVLARGFGSKGRVDPSLSTAGDAATLSRTLVVRMRAEGKDSVVGELVLPGFTSVQTIELLALRYDDGTSWNALPRMPCSVKPDLLMLVADR